jgi:hypothetical protein
MAKLTAILVTLIGLLLVLKEQTFIDLSVITNWNGWIIAIAVLAVGIGKLMRNFKK